jgi:S-adenosylmethionine:tRNA ribosyltransferase-isomerase
MITQPATATVQFELAPELEAHEPPEAHGRTRDDVRLMVSRSTTGELSHHAFRDLTDLLLPGDLLVVNNSGTLPAAVAVDSQLMIHFSTAMPEGDWLVELRTGRGATTVPLHAGAPGDRLVLPGGAVLTLSLRFSQRLWRARLSTAVIPYLLKYGAPIRYSYVPVAWSIAAYQTVFAVRPGSAEMPSAGRPFTPDVVTSLVSRGIAVAPITLHTGVSSLEGGEDPYPESYDVPAPTARLVNLTRQSGGRVIAVGTTVVRALETAALRGDCPGENHPAGSRTEVSRADVSRTGGGCVSASAGWTSHIVTPQTGVGAVDGLLTGLHEPKSTHLWMLAAFASSDLLTRSYAAAASRGYHWHEFGDVHLLLP